MGWAELGSRGGDGHSMRLLLGTLKVMDLAEIDWIKEDCALLVPASLLGRGVSCREITFQNGTLLYFIWIFWKDRVILKLSWLFHDTYFFDTRIVYRRGWFLTLIFMWSVWDVPRTEEVGIQITLASKTGANVTKTTKLSIHASHPASEQCCRAFLDRFYTSSQNK